MKNKIKNIIAWISLKIYSKINRVKQQLELKKMYRITEDIVNMPSRERKQHVAKMRYRFRKNKTRGKFINDWCDEIAMLGDVLDEERKEYGDELKLKYVKLKKHIQKNLDKAQ